MYTHATVDAAVGRENTVIVVLAAIPVVASGTEIASWPLAGLTAGLTSVNCSTVADDVDAVAILYPLICVPKALVATP